jgi:hypothetical protein
MNGIPNPDGPQTPEEEQAAAEAAKKAQMMSAIEQATLEATLAKLQAEVAKLTADGKKVDSASILDRINAIKAAVEAAVQVVSVPAVTPAADVLLEGAGFPTALQPPYAVPAGPPMPSPGMPTGAAPPMAA